MNKALCIALLVFSNTAYSAAVIGEACVTTTGNQTIDRVKARAMAKGNLSQELGATVSAKTKLETKTIETTSSIDTQDTLTETVTLTSKNFVSRVETVNEGYEKINGEKHYCVRLKQQGR